jgi:hypothetical protein
MHDKATRGMHRQSIPRTFATLGRRTYAALGRDGQPRGPGNLAVTRYLESGETPNNCIVCADPRFPERTGKRT